MEIGSLSEETAAAWWGCDATVAALVLCGVEDRLWRNVTWKSLVDIQL